MKKSNAKKVDVYKIVTDKLIKELENGVIPWRKPWINGGAVNWVKQRPYRGINTMLLDAGEYATFKQVSDAGGKVKKGEEGHIVVFWKWIEKEDKETGDKETVPFIRYSKVFEINKQCEGLRSKKSQVSFEHDPVEEAEAIIQGYMNSPTYSYNSGKAYYQPTRDHVNVPPMKDFPNIDEYYSTFFHEIVHSTGHQERLKRPGVTRSTVAFGDEVYSKEELVAEIGAAMLCGVAQIDNSTIKNSASYLHSWLRELKNDSKLLVQASAQAQKAADYILGTKFDREAEA